jgi:hypothetical protein
LIENPELMLSMAQYLQHVKKDNRVAQENFLNPYQIEKFKDEMYKRTEFLYKNKGPRDKVIWRPRRFVISKDIRGMIEKRD